MGATLSCPGASFAAHAAEPGSRVCTRGATKPCRDLRREADGTSSRVPRRAVLVRVPIPADQLDVANARNASKDNRHWH